MHHATAGSFLGISGVVWFWVLTIVGVGWVVLSLSRRLSDMEHLERAQQHIVSLRGQ